MKKLLSLFIVASLVVTSVINTRYIVAQETTPTVTPTPADTGAQKAIADKIREYEAKLSETRTQKNTLSSQIDYMDTQRYLTELKAEETKTDIVETEAEIKNLGKRITGLDSSLDGLSKSLLERIAAGYKNRQASLIDILLDSTSASTLTNRMKYYEIARDSNQKVLLQVQEAKLNFEEQKDLRENKVEELEQLTLTLEAQEQALVSQQQEKRILLQATQNDEATYSRLLQEARRQQAAFTNFVQSTGVGVVGANSLGTGEGGWYLSQRDERWANTLMGTSSENILNVGCFITSISMVMREDGVDFYPTQMANDTRYFLPGTAYMYIPSSFNGSWPNGKNYRNISYGEISSYLSQGTPVIAGVNGSSHYIVLKREADGTFIMNDPIYGPDLKVSDHYSLSGPYGIFQ